MGPIEAAALQKRLELRQQFFASPDVAHLRQENQELRLKLFERDTEIKILNRRVEHLTAEITSMRKTGEAEARYWHSMKTIMKEVCTEFKVSVDDLTGPLRTKASVVPRQVAMYLGCKFTKKSTPQIGEVLGGRDHTTVMYGRDKIKKLLLVDKKLEESVRRIEKILDPVSA